MAQVWEPCSRLTRPIKIRVILLVLTIRSPDPVRSLFARTSIYSLSLSRALPLLLLIRNLFNAHSFVSSRLFPACLSQSPCHLNPYGGPAFNNPNPEDTSTATGQGYAVVLPSRTWWNLGNSGPTAPEFSGLVVPASGSGTYQPRPTYTIPAVAIPRVTYTLPVRLSISSASAVNSCTATLLHTLSRISCASCRQPGCPNFFGRMP